MDNLPLIPTEEIEGVVESFTYHNEENGYSVVKIRPKDQRKAILAVGHLPGVQPGETLSIKGEWTTHPNYGRQLEIRQYSVHPPATADAIRRYLGSGLLKGVGEATARQITDYFGDETLEILDQHPQRLAEVPKIGRKRANQIIKSWQEQKQAREVMLFLHQYGVGAALSVKIARFYGHETIKVIKRDPYQLMRDIEGIGFITADKIALEMGTPTDAAARIQAGLVYALETMSQEGHCFAERPQLIETCSRLIHLSPELCAQQIDAMLERKALLSDEHAIYLPYYYQAEHAVAAGLKKLMVTSKDALGFLSNFDWQETAGQPAVQELVLTAEQQQAVKMIFSNKVSILTGGPGTGKSTITGAIIHYVQSFGNSILLAAPTGRAAKRLSEATGLEALTIHRLLEFSPKNNAFTRDRSHPLDTDLLIIDETSMVDILLMNSLIDAVQEGTHVLFIGDADQLPSVGAGNVLRDMIDSQAIPTIRLTHIFRQAENSYIVQNAHAINQGQFPEFPPDSADFFLFGTEDSQKAEDWIIDIVTRKLPEKFGIRPEEIQVLSPMYRGPAGVNALNQRLQNALNPAGAGRRQYQSGERIFRERDRVMQLRNNYDKLVFNGDIGEIQRIDTEERLIVARYDERTVPYEYSELDETQLAYAVSIHKSQGSEFPAVVIPMISGHYIMLQRNLLYTAITRARRMVVLVGSRKAIATAVNNNKTTRRNTRLGALLSAN